MENKNVMLSTYAFPISFAADLLEEDIVLKRESNCIEYGLSKLMSELETELFDMWEQAYTSRISGNTEDICKYSQINSKCYGLIYDFIKEVFTMPIFISEEDFFNIFIEMINEWQIVLFDEWKELKTQE